MSIQFTPEQWDRVKTTYRKWWAGELDRPLLAISVGGYPKTRPAPQLPIHGFQAFYGPEVSVEQIVDGWDYQLDGTRFLGDAFPAVLPNFGPGVLAAFLGARVENGTSTVWFHPPEPREIRDLHFALDADCFWFRRISELMQAAGRRWQGLVQVGMTDLGGNLDVLSTFRPAERLLFDLYDHPVEVKRLTWDAHVLWWRAFDALNAALRPTNPGFTAWTPIYSELPYYMLQCDFCYMIGPAMFDEFVKPELAASCRRLGNAFYHLDGPGQLPHLDSLLSIPELKGVQWVPGSGAPDVTHWPEVYRKIRAAGKLVQVFTGQSAAGLKIIDVLADQIGDARGIIVIGGVSRDQEDAARRCLERYGAG
jgi:5-methyltetrahydrofolate--homocysteine methyltransferase